MTRKEAEAIAHTEYKETGKPQAIVKLARLWHGQPAYYPIEARWASGLSGEVVGVIGGENEAK